MDSVVGRNFRMSTNKYKCDHPPSSHAVPPVPHVPSVPLSRPFGAVPLGRPLGVSHGTAAIFFPTFRIQLSVNCRTGNAGALRDVAD
jgi:hypothetical protein